ncbi:adenosylcobinamide-GDP ribazoletransferase [Clostridium sp. NSJ-49]|uniref:adenosylcobinamide-GDP ribazoletransferase n=1 Tax=Clostridium TaxID=1485 RepID=UPI00164AF724|nr:adenosylcobinamide-GDP ribazoletransferase [Clostridium sp. NSJ-49]MBC5626391.1 adenosylcobinamide-GDP ribazoletransferase [Clostridium sp. NSJ-49]
MKRYFENFLLMLQVLTRIPINKSLPCENTDFKRGANFFAIVGLVIGLIQFIVYSFLIKFFNLDIAVIFVIIIDILITGGFHIDGFGDTCDGFFATKGKDKIIDIMKDSRIGTFACIGIIINILIKFIGYTTILNNITSYIIILLPMISRVSIVLISYIGKAAKEIGSGNLFINTVTFKEVIINYLLFILIAVFMVDIKRLLIIVIISSITTILFNKYCNSKINGITGDSLGANNELVMLILLIVLSCNF